MSWERTKGDRYGQGRRTAAALANATHPSAVLRADDRETAYRSLVADLTVVAEELAKR